MFIPGVRFVMLIFLVACVVLVCLCCVSCIQLCLCFLSLLPVLSSGLRVTNCVLLCVSAFFGSVFMSVTISIK